MGDVQPVAERWWLLSGEWPATVAAQTDLNLAAYRALCAEHDVDPQVELTEVRLVHALDPVEWIAARLACHELGRSAPNPAELGDPAWARQLAEAAQLNPNPTALRVLLGGATGTLGYALAAAAWKTDPVERVLATSPDPNVVGRVARFTSRSELAAQLATHPHPMVRRNLAYNSYAPYLVLAELSRDPDPVIARAAEDTRARQTDRIDRAW